MHCEQFKELLHHVFLEGVTDKDMLALRAHAEQCEPCGTLMGTAEELNCREFVEFLIDYFEGELPPERKAIFDRHLAICPDCQNYLVSYRQTVEASKRALAEDEYASRPLPLEVMRAILEARKKDS